MLLTELNKPRILEPEKKQAFDYFKKRNENIFGNINEKIDTAFFKKMKKLGWKITGSGMYSNVFLNPTKNYVLKINMREDIGYQRYVELIHRSRTIHFPKISDEKFLTLGGDTYGMYLIEKLRHLPKPYNYAYAEIITKITEACDSPINIIVKWFNENYGDDPNKITLPISLIKASQKLGKYYNQIDIHEDNIMQRADGTIVITDPYV
jgi:hypothetical protein